MAAFQRPWASKSRSWWVGSSMTGELGYYRFRRSLRKMDGGCWNAGFLHRPETRFLRVDGISARFCIGGIAESIAQPGLRQNILRILGIALDLFAKHPHVGSQVLGPSRGTPSPGPDLVYEQGDSRGERAKDDRLARDQRLRGQFTDCPRFSPSCFLEKVLFSYPLKLMKMGPGSPGPIFLLGDSLRSGRFSKLFIVINRLATEWGEDVWLEVRFTPEIEHVQQRSRELIKRALGHRRSGRMIEISDAAKIPIILDKTNDGRLVGSGVIDKVALGPGRNHQHGQTCAVTAAAEIGARGWYSAIESAVQDVRAR